MIIVTGGGGFVGSALVWKLNQMGRHDIIIVDQFGTADKWKNLAKRQFANIIHKDKFRDWLAERGQGPKFDVVFHMGACSATTQRDVDYLVANNIQYSMDLFNYCTHREIPFIYASSASTYGNGARGFVDNQNDLSHLCPLNPYGFSKNTFDRWVLARADKPPYWAGLKFFNVYGPQEYHKGDQASVVFHFFPQAVKEGVIRLFKSYKQGYADGEQVRDFVYVKDVVEIMWRLFENPKKSGIFNIGSGRGRTYLDLARAVFNSVGKPFDVKWIEMPEELREHYQYFTEAKLDNLRELGGFNGDMTDLDAGVRDYVQGYLIPDDHYL